MNLGIVTSFLVGGLLLVAMLQFNNRVMQSSTELTLDMMDNSQVETIRQIISRDFNRIGFGDGSKINNFNPPHFINFKADVNDLGTSTVIWHFKENVQIHGTSNPADRELQRNGPIDSTGGSKPLKFNVVDFSITGYKDTQGNIETEDKDEVKSFLVEIIYESPEPVSSSEDYYPRSVWRKHFVPNNLQFKKLNN